MPDIDRRHRGVQVVVVLKNRRRIAGRHSPRRGPCNGRFGARRSRHNGYVHIQLPVIEVLGSQQAFRLCAFPRKDYGGGKRCAVWYEQQTFPVNLELAGIVPLAYRRAQRRRDVARAATCGQPKEAWVRTGGDLNGMCARGDNVE